MTRAARAQGAIFGLCVGIIVVGVLWLVISTYQLTRAIRETQKPTAQTIDLISETLDIIKDCTEPTGECYRRGKQQNADTIDDLTKASIYAAYCAARHEGQTVAEIHACVMQQFQARTP